MTPYSTCEHTIQSFSHIFQRSIILIILLKISLLTFLIIIQVAILTTMQFFLIFCFYRATKSCQKPSSMESKIFLFMSISLIRLDYYSQLAKPSSFSLLNLLKILLFLLLSIIFFESLHIRQVIVNQVFITY